MFNETLSDHATDHGVHSTGHRSVHQMYAQLQIDLVYKARILLLFLLEIIQAVSHTVPAGATCLIALLGLPGMSH